MEVNSPPFFVYLVRPDVVPSVIGEPVPCVNPAVS